MKRFEEIVMLVVIVCSIGIGYTIGEKRGRNRPILPTEEKVDTLYIKDTITLTEPVYVTRRFVDSVLVPVTDTLRLRDTLFVYLEKEQIEWRDSLSVVYASGINPQVDSVRHFVQERIITKTIQVVEYKRPRWGIGIQGGYGVSKEGLAPYIGIGVQYNILTW